MTENQCPDLLCSVDSVDGVEEREGNRTMGLFIAVAGVESQLHLRVAGPH